MHERNRVAVALLVAVLSCTGCAARMRSFASDAPRAAVPSLVDESLNAGEDARTRERVKTIMATPEMQATIEEVARAAVAGAVDGMSTEVSKERIAALARDLSKVLSEAVAAGVRDEIAPAIVAGARDSIRAELGPRERQELQAAISSGAITASTAAARSAGEEIATHVMPALRESLVRELDNPELRLTIDSLVDGVTRQMLASTVRATQEARARNEAMGELGVIGRIRRALTLSWMMAFALGVAAVAVLAWGVRLRRRAKRYRGALVAMSEERAEGNSPDEARTRRLVELLD